MLSSDNLNMINPLVQIYDILSIQEVSLRIKEINQRKFRKRGKNSRGGKKIQKQKQKRKAKSESPPSGRNAI